MDELHHRKDLEQQPLTVEQALRQENAVLRRTNQQLSSDNESLREALRNNGASEE